MINIYHEAKSKYSYIYEKDKLHLRNRIERNEVKKLSVVYFDPFSWIQGSDNPHIFHFDKSKIYQKEMFKETSNDNFDFWFCELDDIHTKRIRYGFLLTTAKGDYFFGPEGLVDIDVFNNLDYNLANPVFKLFYLFPYILGEDSYEAPSWVKDTIWYQIYIDSFCKADDNFNIINFNKTYKTYGTDVFFGGNIKGVITKLDYLKDLGITGIYFTPIFESPSNHKYDTVDYFKIEPSLGLNEDFKLLVKEAHKRGIKVILDAVFNHCGWAHPFWQDVVKNGRKSKYFDCFYIKREPVVNFDYDKNIVKGNLKGEINYYTFGFERGMPKWNTSNEFTRKYLLDVSKYWVKEYDIDGWRLDVANEVSHDFWRQFRKEVKAIKNDVFILGESWEESYPWLQGDQFDSVMNYELMYLIWSFIGEKRYLREKINVDKFINNLNSYLVTYPKNVVENMFNFVDSHDTVRMYKVCNDNIKRLKLAFLLLMIMPGTPSIYYASESKMKNDNNRYKMPWDNLELDIYSHIKELIELRKKHPTFKSTNFEFVSVDVRNNAFTLKKAQENEILYLFVNNSDKATLLSNPLDLNDVVKLNEYDYKIVLQTNL